jgi:hypothetical protein
MTNYNKIKGHDLSLQLDQHHEPIYSSKNKEEAFVEFF